LVQLTITDPPGVDAQDNDPARENEETVSPAVETDSNQTQEKEKEDVFQVMDMLLSKKRARDRKHWIETHGVIKEI
jgi:topoisomerase-4 subunit B